MSYLLVELVASTPVSHGDPGARNASNVAPFRMQEVLYARPSQTMSLEAGEPIGSETFDLHMASIFEVESALAAFCQQFPLPDTSVAQALQQLSAEQFVATAFITTLITQLNSINGSGLFVEKARYDMLLKRMGIVSAQFNTSFFTLYSSLLRELNVTETLPKMEDLLYLFAALPRSFQLSSISALGKDRHSVLMLARAWYNAKRESKIPVSQLYTPQGKFAGTSLQDVEAFVPDISTNALRHSIFREVLCVHLLKACGYQSVAEVSQQQLLPDFVIQLLSNGGNVKDGAVPPDNREAMNAAIKRTFPSIELLSGCMPSHILGEGMLLPANWTLCLQNNDATLEYGYHRDIDAAELLFIETNTRQTPEGMAASRESGQMIFGQTLMKKGTRILLKVAFHPFTSVLAKGAAFFALQEWLAQGGQVGGKDGTGKGHFRLSPQGIEVRLRGIEDPDDLARYEVYARLYQQYIQENVSQLKEALVSGTLGWREPLHVR